MATIINADTVVGGAQITGDASGVLELQAAGSTKATINGSGLSLASALPVGSGGTGATTLTSNNVILGNGGSAVQFVAPGTNGNVLTSNGTTWTSAAASSGALTLISTTTVSTPVNAIDVTSGFSSTYDNYMVLCENLRVSGSGSYAQFRLYTGGVLRTADYSTCDITWQTATSVGRSAADTTVGVTNGMDTNNTLNISMQFFSVNTGARNAVIMQVFQGSSSGATNIQGSVRAINQWGNSSAVTGFRLYLVGADNWNAGTIRLYGVQK